jgi:hypothetical protein
MLIAANLQINGLQRVATRKVVSFDDAPFLSTCDQWPGCIRQLSFSRTAAALQQTDCFTR